MATKHSTPKGRLVRADSIDPASRSALTAQVQNQALSFVVVGASGDLAKKKTFPCLFSLYKKDLLPKQATFWGYARSKYDNESFRKELRDNLKGSDKEVDAFLQRCSYLSGQYDSMEDFGKLGQQLQEAEKRHGGPDSNRVFYLAIPAVVFLDALKCIHDCALSSSGWNRMVIEKPFGSDSASSAKLNTKIRELFAEEQIFRVDHYLGKELVMNVLVLRFANTAFLPIWNRNYISNVVITFKEDILVEGRAGYFDEFGIIRDVMQNHLMQILAMIAMEPPVIFSAEYVQDEKAKVLRACSPVKLDELVVGQFEGYLDDKAIPRDSRTPTYAAAILHIHNQRWDGVPFIMKCGKGLDERKTEIRIQFRDVPGLLFPAAQRNELVIRVQPDEAMYMKLMTKAPGLGDIADLAEVELDLTYGARYKISKLPDAYERVLLEVTNGDRSHFVRADELEAAWDIWSPVLHELEEKRIQPLRYKVGIRSPKEADELIEKAGFQRSEAYAWHNPYDEKH